jgi:gliding motility-associated lipoprotein GldD
MKNSIWLLLLIVFAACKEEIAMPKPRMYPRVIFPEHSYQPFDENYCHFNFEMPKYAKVEQDTTFFDEKPADPCWFNLDIPELNAKLYCSYYPITAQNPLEKLRNDAFKIASKHNIKADFIDELPISKPDGTSGFIFNLEGPVASPFQFYLTDSTHHFLHGSLYINAQVNTDSLAPVIEFLKVDVMHAINTLTWKH